MPSFRLILLSSVVILTGCAYAMESQLQDVTVLTPGALNARCVVNIDGFRYKYRPPETINVKKSHKDMIVDCIAPGNRERQIVISPRKSELDSYNFANGYIIGAGLDHLSGARYQYPDVIYVDFTGIPHKPEELPAHNAFDIKQPEEYDLEEFLPGQPRLNSDRYSVPVPLQKRSRPRQLFSDTTAFQQMMESPAPATTDGAMGTADIREQQDLIDMADPSGAADVPETQGEAPFEQSPPPETSIDPALMNPATVEPPPEAVAAPPAPEPAPVEVPPQAVPEPVPESAPAAEPTPVQGPPAPPAATTPADGTQGTTQSTSEPMPTEPAPFPPPEFLQKKQQNQ